MMKLKNMTRPLEAAPFKKQDTNIICKKMSRVKNNIEVNQSSMMSPDPAENFKGKNSIEDSGQQGLIFQTNVTGSSSEDDTDNVEYNGYEPLSQDPNSMEEEGEIDYSSLSGLLAAVNAHGPNTIATSSIPQELPEDAIQNESLMRNIPAQIPFQEMCCQAEAEKENEFKEEQSQLWNSTPVAANQIIIDEKKVAEIKSVMANIRLPSSSVPAWVNQMSDEDLKLHVNSVIYGKDKNTHNKDAER